MAKEAVFTMKLEPELRDAFMAAAAEVDRPASQVIRELMRGYVERAKDARDYADFSKRKAAKARAQIDAGLAIPHDEVEQHFARKRQDALRRSGKAGR